MNTSQFTQYLLLALGLYCLVRGIMILTTGKLSEREEAKLSGYSAKGLKRYKILSAVMNIVGAVLIIGLSVLKLLNVVNLDLFRIIALVILVVLMVAYFIVANSCKKA